MKVIGVLICFVMMLGTYCFGEVTSKIIAQDIDDKGNIRVWSSHAIDGKEVESRYPKIDGHYVYCTRYSKQNFKDCKDTKDIETHILNDIKNHTNTLVQKEFDKNAVKTLSQIRIDYNIEANQAFADTNLKGLVGKEVSAVSVTQEIDSDNDGVSDKTLTLNQDGQKLEKNIITL